MTAAELIARLRVIPPDSIIGIRGDGDLLYHLVDFPLYVDEWGVAQLARSRRVISEEDVS